MKLFVTLPIKQNFAVQDVYFGMMLGFKQVRYLDEFVWFLCVYVYINHLLTKQIKGLH